MSGNMDRKIEFETLLNRITSRIPNEFETESGIKLRDQLSETLTAHWNTPPLDTLKNVEQSVKYNLQRSATFHDLQNDIQYECQIQTENDARRIIFFPQPSDMTVYAAAIATSHSTQGLQRLCLALLYLEHMNVTPLCTSFILNNGLSALVTHFVDPNLYIRSQAMDAFRQISSNEEFKWHDPPMNDEQTDLQKAMFHLTEGPILHALVVNSNESFPGGSFMALQLLAWWLSWMRLLHTDGTLILSKSLLDILSNWGNHTDSAESDDNMLQQELNLAKQLVNDFTRFGSFDNADLNDNTNHCYEIIASSYDSPIEPKYKSSQWIDASHLQFCAAVVWKRQAHTHTNESESQTKNESSSSSSNTLETSFQTHENERNHVRHELQRVDEIKLKGNRAYKKQKLAKAINVYSDGLKYLSGMDNDHNEHPIWVEFTLQFQQLKYSLLSNRAMSYLKAARLALDQGQVSNDTFETDEQSLAESIEHDDESSITTDKSQLNTDTETSQTSQNSSTTANANQKPSSETIRASKNASVTSSTTEISDANQNTSSETVISSTSEISETKTTTDFEKNISKGITNSVDDFQVDLDGISCLLRCIYDCQCALGVIPLGSLLSNSSSLPYFHVTNTTLSVIRTHLTTFTGTPVNDILYKILFRCIQAMYELGQLNDAIKIATLSESVLSVSTSSMKDILMKEIENLKCQIQHASNVLDLAKCPNSLLVQRFTEQNQTFEEQTYEEAEITAALLHRTEYGGTGGDIDAGYEEEERNWRLSKSKATEHLSSTSNTLDITSTKSKTTNKPEDMATMTERSKHSKTTNKPEDMATKETSKHFKTTNKSNDMVQTKSSNDHKNMVRSKWPQKSMKSSTRKDTQSPHHMIQKSTKSNTKRKLQSVHHGIFNSKQMEVPSSKNDLDTKQVSIQLTASVSLSKLERYASKGNFIQAAKEFSSESNSNKSNNRVRFEKWVQDLDPSKLSIFVGDGLSEALIIALISSLYRLWKRHIIFTERCLQILMSLAKLPRFNFLFEFIENPLKNDLQQFIVEIMHEGTEDAVIQEIQQFYSLQ